jgi:Na+-driven multidrug efflux pump
MKVQNYLICIVKVFLISFGILIYGVLHSLFFIIATITCAKLGTTETAAFGLGTLTVGFVAMSILGAFNSGLLTFCSAASGVKDYRGCIIYRNRTIFLDTCLFAFLSIPMLWIESIFASLGQDPEVAKLAVMYVNIVFPSVYFYCCFQAISFYCGTV